MLPSQSPVPVTPLIKRTASDYVHAEKLTRRSVECLAEFSFDKDDKKRAIYYSVKLGSPFHATYSVGLIFSIDEWGLLSATPNYMMLVESIVRTTVPVLVLERMLAGPFQTENVQLVLDFTEVDFPTINEVSALRRSLTKAHRTTLQWMPHKPRNSTLQILGMTPSIADPGSGFYPDLSDMVIHPNTYTIADSGGKDSLLADEIMHGLGFKPYKFNHTTKHHLGWESPEEHTEETGVFFHMEFHSEMDRELFHEKEYAHAAYLTETRHSVMFDEQSDMGVLYMLPLVLYVIHHDALPRYVVLGSEWGCSPAFADNDDYQEDLAYDEGLYVARQFDLLKSGWGLGSTAIRLISPIACLNETAILFALYQKGKSWEDFKSCWGLETIFRGNENIRACESCAKCLRMKRINRYLMEYDTHRFYHINVGMIKGAEKNIPPLSPSMFTYSVQSNWIYEALSKLDMSAAPQILCAYNSSYIREFMGGRDLSELIFQFLLTRYGLPTNAEPAPQWDLNLTRHSELVPQVLKVLQTEDHWGVLWKQHQEAAKSPDFLKVPGITEFDLPFEQDYFLIHYNGMFPLYSYFEDWLFYTPQGEVLTIHLQWPGEKPGCILGERTPEFTSPIMRNALQWGKDKVDYLDLLIQTGKLKKWWFTPTQGVTYHRV